ncbi:hypothetical protein M9Y10_032505 [Tritrichomonas musculus]|uniref:Protein kinase domain-containing protein n=1 Tax=Tritrichomonas musculus TaxID=1915356 RepID=A0ABR2GYN3_9EUKA
MLNYEQKELVSENSSFKFYKVINKDKDGTCLARMSSKLTDDYNKKEINNLSREINIIPRLNHPSVSKFIYFSQVNFDNNPCPTIISEYYSKGTLDQIISQQITNLTATEKLIIVYGIACGMMYLHSNGILHCDLKPANISIDDHLYPKITGFYISHQISSYHKSDKYVIQGTPAYIAPEIYLTEGNSKASDVYAFSLIVYELITNQKPFSEFNDVKQIQKTVIKEGFCPCFPQDTPEAYKKLIEQCCSQFPDDRPKFKEIVNELKNNRQFITDEVNFEQYQNYISMIESSEKSFESQQTVICDFEEEKRKAVSEYASKQTFKGIYETELTNLSLFLATEQEEPEKGDYESTLIDLVKYRKEKVIAKGGTANIRNIFEKETNKLYIAKEYLYNKVEDLFKREVETNYKVNGHPCFVEYIGYSLLGFNPQRTKKKKYPVIVLKYYSNGSLAQVLKLENDDQPMIGWNGTKKLINIYGIAFGMAYLHSIGFIHRDLKPGNVLLDGAFLPKICDFTTSKSCGEKINDTVQQTTAYIMAPEAIEGNNDLQASDVYSFAIVMYEIVTGDDPYGDSSMYSIIQKVMDGERPAFKTQIPDCYRRLIEKCWSQKPEDRPTFNQIVTELRTNREFITDEIDEDEYFHYIEYLDDPENVEYDFETFTKLKQNKSISVNLEPINLSKFEKIKGRIGKGSFGKVYKVIENLTKKICACKISIQEINDCEDSEIMNIQRELNVISQLDCPTILKFIGFNPLNFKDEPRPTILTEYIKNGSLDELLDNEQRGLSVKEWDDTKKLINIFGIAHGIQYMHSKNIIHRDLKPGNIFLDEYLFPKIGDFGLSKTLENDLKSGLKGTYAYMSPEIFTSHQYGKPGDIYAFGMIVYEIITGEKIFKGFSQIQLMFNVIQGYRPPFKFPIPNCYKELIESCWHNDPEQRPTIDEIVELLKTNEEFITDTVEPDEFYDYIDLIDGNLPESGTTSGSNKTFKEVSINISSQLDDELLKDDPSLNESFLDLSKFSRPKLSVIIKSDIANVCNVQNKETGKFYSAKIFNFELTKLRRDELINLSREVNIISKINHPSFLKFIGYSPTDFAQRQHPVIITETFSKETLASILSLERDLVRIPNWDETTKLINIYGIAAGMSYLHSHNILHRDLTPESIFFNKNLHPKIGNFGLCILNHTLESMTNQSMSGIKGNPCYSAPEVLQMNEYSKAGDVYSFAFLVYEIVTNEVPFKNIKSNLSSLFNEIVIKAGRPEIKNNVPCCYCSLIESCWAQDPKDRPTFDQIEYLLKTEKDFLGENVDKEKFLSYVRSIEESNVDFYSGKKIVQLDDLIRSKSRIDESGELNESRENDDEDENIGKERVEDELEKESAMLNKIIENE